MTETAAQREERRRRAAEMALWRGDEFDGVRIARHRREPRGRSGGSRATIAALRRGALEAYARRHGLTLDELLDFGGGSSGQWPTRTCVAPTCP